MDNLTVKHKSDKSRFAVAWVIVLIATVCLVFVCIYSSSAVLMLFGKGELNLKSYQKALETIDKDDRNFANLSADGDWENGYIKYNTSDNVGKYMIIGRNNRIVSIHVQLNLQDFANLGVVQKYHCVDAMLRPLYVSSDLLAAEIAIVRTSGKLAIIGISNRTPTTFESYTKDMKTEFSIDHTDLIVSMYAV